jgi:LacI family repressor for deo operon, udp, cdd, tsx, nupC, and nupG
MRNAGLSIHKSFILTSDKRFAEAGKDCMQRLMASGRLPSVIVAAYDQIAYGAMKYARDMGLRVPEDISFVGMDDITADSYFDVPLSSVHSAYESVCEKITDLIFMRMENKHYRMKEKIVVPVELNIRESLKNLKAESDR